MDLPKTFYCVDVEAVATGYGDSDRTPCLVVVMDQDERVLLKTTIRVDKPIVNYHTPLIDECYPFLHRPKHMHALHGCHAI